MGTSEGRGIARPDTKPLKALKQIAPAESPPADGIGPSALGDRGPQRPIAGDGGHDSGLADRAQGTQQHEATEQQRLDPS
jgi:hypothetical protein